jgi:hypothetical protein
MRLTHHSLFPHGRGARAVRANVWRIARQACYGEGGVMHDDGRLWVETQKYERQCRRCRKWFWAWEPVRTHCYVCQPLPRAELTSFIAALESGNGHGNGTGHAGGSALGVVCRIGTAGVNDTPGEDMRGGGTARALRPADLCGAQASR